MHTMDRDLDNIINRYLQQMHLRWITSNIVIADPFTMLILKYLLFIDVVNHLLRHQIQTKWMVNVKRPSNSAGGWELRGGGTFRTIFAVQGF